ncbi:hypothetical protein [uncultured Legionella sp.]|uniref:hypothetical protein n=1 Tax=uncultured Legionella sp. TaxID=210934 RepID=UPI002622A2A3|nr:hypothetical protein [uncultured Legionella sp.]
MQISLKCIETVLDQSRASKLVELVPNQNIIEKFLSALSDIVSSIGNFFANIGKSEEQQNKEKFASYKEKYKAQQPLPVDTLESTEESELNEVQEPDAEEHSSFTLK